MPEGGRRGALTLVLAILAALAFVLLVLVFVVPFFYPWTSVNCWHDDIDITCGRYRYERLLLGMRVAVRIEETSLSRMYRKLVGEPPEPVWRRVNTFSPGVRNSPHYVHHSALHAASTLLQAFGLTSFTEDAKRTAILTFFGLLREDDDDGRAGEYADAVCAAALDAVDGGVSEFGSDLLPERPQRVGGGR